MYVIRAANGNIYPIEKVAYRIGAATGGGYKLTHVQLIGDNAGTVAPALNATPATATAGDELGYLGKSGRFVPISEPAT